MKIKGFKNEGQLKVGKVQPLLKDSFY